MSSLLLTHALFTPLCAGTVEMHALPHPRRRSAAHQRQQRLQFVAVGRSGCVAATAPSTSPPPTHTDWAHAICALWIPSVKWQDEDRKFRGVDVSKVGKSEYGANACYICSEKGRPELASTGICIPCSVPNCPRRFHATWFVWLGRMSLCSTIAIADRDGCANHSAHASGLTDIVEKGDGKVVYSGTCKTHRREKAKASEKAAAEKVERERAANAAKEKAAEKATAQARAAAQRAAREKAAKEKAAAMAKERTERLQRQAERAAAKSKAPSAGSSGSGDPVVCVAPGCSRVFNSLISLRNHERSAHVRKKGVGGKGSAARWVMTCPVFFHPPRRAR